MAKIRKFKDFTIQKIFGLFVISLALIAAAGALAAILVYGVMMVVWQHAPIFEVLVLCLLFSIPLVAIVLMLTSFGLSLLRKSVIKS
jgi:hypothetical protein